MDRSIIMLTNDRIHVEIDPSYGGRVTSFWSEGKKGRIDWFVPTPKERRDPRRPLKTGMFPLVPFSNRIRDGTFMFQGRDFVLEKSGAANAHATHGHGCWNHWSIINKTKDSACIVFSHHKSDWPSSYQASQQFVLDRNGLLVCLTVENTGVSTMPVGLGLHPFLPQRRRVTLKTEFRTIWPAGTDSIPVGWEPLPKEFNFSTSKDLPGGLDTGFGDWNGEAMIAWPIDGIGLLIKASGQIDHAIIYTPIDQDFFCFEPVTHPINAINLGAGMPIIGPGEKFEASVIYEPLMNGI